MANQGPMREQIKTRLDSIAQEFSDKESKEFLEKLRSEIDKAEDKALYTKIFELIKAYEGKLQAQHKKALDDFRAFVEGIYKVPENSPAIEALFSTRSVPVQNLAAASQPQASGAPEQQEEMEEEEPEEKPITSATGEINISSIEKELQRDKEWFSVNDFNRVSDKELEITLKKGTVKAKEEESGKVTFSASTLEENELEGLARIALIEANKETVLEIHAGHPNAKAMFEALQKEIAKRGEKPIIKWIGTPEQIEKVAQAVSSVPPAPPLAPPPDAPAPPSAAAPTPSAVVPPTPPSAPPPTAAALSNPPPAPAASAAASPGAPPSTAAPTPPVSAPPAPPPAAATGAPGIPATPPLSGVAAPGAPEEDNVDVPSAPPPAPAASAAVSSGAPPSTAAPTPDIPAAPPLSGVAAPDSPKDNVAVPFGPPDIPAAPPLPDDVAVPSALAAAPSIPAASPLSEAVAPDVPDIPEAPPLTEAAATGAPDIPAAPPLTEAAASGAPDIPAAPPLPDDMAVPSTPSPSAPDVSAPQVNPQSSAESFKEALVAKKSALKPIKKDVGVPSAPHPSAPASGVGGLNAVLVGALTGYRKFVQDEEDEPRDELEDELGDEAEDKPEDKPIATAKATLSQQNQAVSGAPQSAPLPAVNPKVDVPKPAAGPPPAIPAAPPLSTASSASSESPQNKNPPDRGDLLAEIRKGKLLKKVGPPSGDKRESDPAASQPAKGISLFGKNINLPNLGRDSPPTQNEVSDEDWEDKDSATAKSSEEVRSAVLGNPGPPSITPQATAGAAKAKNQGQSQDQVQNSSYKKKSPGQ